jgi:signal transduction histidine kinase
VQALRDLAAETSIKSGVVTVVDVDETVAAALAPSATDVVQLTRELLSNVGRHARASTCRVSLRADDDGDAFLEVDDDGEGFDPTSVTSGMGLANAEARVRGLGGRLTVVSQPGTGTTVRAVLPL